MGDAVAVDSRAIATTASRRQRHRSHEARRLWYGRIDAIDATARRIDSGHCVCTRSGCRRPFATTL